MSKKGTTTHVTVLSKHLSIFYILLAFALFGAAVLCNATTNVVPLSTESVAVPPGSKTSIHSENPSSMKYTIDEVINAQKSRTGSCGKNCSYSFLENGTISITGTGDMNNYSSKSDIPWVNDNIASVIINDGITSIGNHAFDDCVKLTSVAIPSSVTFIGEYAFCGCSALESVTLGNNTNSIRKGTFQSTKLTSIVIPYSVTSIGDYAFFDCRKLTSVDIPESVTSFGDHSFDDCDELISIDIPASVTYIGSYAIGDCKKLVSINVNPNNTKYSSIDGVLFDKKLKTIVRFPTGNASKSYRIPESVSSIGKYAFEYCRSLTSVTISNSVTVIEYGAFIDSALSSVNIPDSVTSIGMCAFFHCSSLTSVTLGKGVTEIEYGAFESSALTSVNIPDSVTSIERSAFSGCNNLTSINVSPNHKKYASIDGVLFDKNLETLLLYPTGNATMSYEIPDSVTSIEEFSFSGCRALTSVVIPNSVTSIGDWSFHNCGQLVNVTLGNNVIHVGDRAFDLCRNLKYNEYGNALYLGTSENPYHALIKANCTNSFSRQELSVYTKVIADEAFEDCSALESIDIPNSVTYIGTGAFKRCSSLISISIPNSVISIGNRAFSGCSNLSSIELPDSVNCIESGTFDDCGALTFNAYDNALYLGTSTNPYNVLIKANSTSITSCLVNENTSLIADEAFTNCKSLVSVVIPNSVSLIGLGAFQYCRSLVSIEIPDSVTSIGDETFWGCGSLTYVCFLGTRDPGTYSSDVFANCPKLNNVTVTKDYVDTVFCGKEVSKNGLCGTLDGSYVEIKLEDGVKAGDINMDELTKIICSTGIPEDAFSIELKTDKNDNVISILVYVGDEQTADNLAHQLNEKKDQCKMDLS